MSVHSQERRSISAQSTNFTKADRPAAGKAKRAVLALAAAASVMGMAHHAGAANINKANTNNLLNDTGSWVGGVVPTNIDTAVWDSTVSTAANANVAIGGNLDWLGIKVVNPAGAVTIAPTSGFSLTLESGGIDMSAATQNLTISTPLILGANQTWLVASGRTLTVSGGISGGSNGFALQGLGAMTLGAAVANTYTGTTAINGAGLTVTNSATALNNIFSSSSSLSLASGYLQVNNIGNAAGHTESFVNTTINQGLSKIRSTRTSGGVPVISLGNLTRNGVGGTLDLEPGSGASIVKVNATGFLGGWAFFGANKGTAPDPSDFAQGNGSAAAVGAVTYTADTWAAGNNTNVTIAAKTIADGTNTQSLRFGTALASTVTLAGTSQITSGGILVNSTVAANNEVITGGILEGSTGGDLIVYQNSASTGTGGGTLTINSTIADATSATALTKAGAQTLVLGGSNTFTGGIFINSGEVRLANPGALNSTTPNAVTFTNGNTTDVLSQVLSLNGNSATVSGLNTTAVVNNPIVQNASATPATFTVSNTTASTYGGLIQDGTGGGALGLTKSGNGTLTLTKTSTYTGNTNINVGTLAFSGAGGLSGSKNINIAAGATLDASALAGGFALSSGTTLSGSGTVNGTVVANNGSAIAPAGAGTVGTLTTTALTLNSGSATNIDFNGGLNDHINVTGANAFTIPASLALPATFNFINDSTSGPFSTNGTYDLIQYNGSINGSLNSLSVANLPFGFSATFGTEVTGGNNFLDVTISGSLVPQWNLTGGGTWNNANSWNPTGIPTGAGLAVMFGSKITAPSTVTLDAAQTVGSIAFSNSNSYTLDVGTGGSLTLDGGSSSAGISDLSGSHTILAPIALNSNLGVVVTNAADKLTISGAITAATTNAISVTGAGTLVLSGSNTYGDTSITGATVQIGDGVSTNGTLGSGNISNNGKLVFNIGGSGPGTLAGNMTGSGSLVKNGATTLTLTGVNTFAGGTTVNGGMVVLGGGQPNLQSAAGAGPITLNNGASFATNGWGDPNAAFVNGGPNYGNLLNALVVPTGQTGTFHNMVRGEFDGAVSGGGTLTFGNAYVRGQIGGDWSGFTGTVNLVADLFLQGDGVNPPAMTTGGDFRINMANFNGSNASFNLASNVNVYDLITGGQIQLGSLTGTGTLGATSNPGGNGLNFIIGNHDTASTVNTFSGKILELNNTHSANITKVGPGTLILASTSSYSGTTTVANGALQFANSTALPNQGATAAPFSFGAAGNTGGILDINGLNLLASSLASVTGGDITKEVIGNSSITSPASITYSTNTSTFNGVIKDSVTVAGQTGNQTVSLNVISGTLVLGNTGNSYTGGTTTGTSINPTTGATLIGTLQLGGGTATGATNGAVVGPITDNGNVAFGSVNAQTIGNLISGSGTVNVADAAAGITTPNPANTYTGTTTFTSGTLSTAVLGPAGSPSGLGQSTANLVFNGGTLQYVGVPAVTLDRGYILQGNGTIDSSGGVLTIPGPTPSATIPNANVTQTLTLTGTNTGANTVAGTITNGIIPSVTAVTKAGVGSWTLGTANNYIGNTAINAGTLKIADNNSLGNGGSMPVGVAVGTSTVAATATLDLNGKTVTEPLVLNGGTLGNSSASASSVTNGVAGTSYVAAGTGVTFSPSAIPTVNFSGGGGSGAAAQVGLGLTLASVTISSGGGGYKVGDILNVVDGGGVNAQFNVATIDAGGGILTLTLRNAGTGFTGLPTNMSDPSNPGADGSAVFTFNDNTFAITTLTTTASGSGYTSAPTVSLSNGTIAATAALAGVSVTGASNIGSSAGDISIAGIVSGAGAITKIGTDTLTLSAVNTQTGAVTVSAGTLNVPVGASLATSSLTVAAGATTNLNGTLTATPAVAANGALNVGANPTPGSGVLARKWGAVTLASTGTINIADSAAHTDRTVLVANSLGFAGTTGAWAGKLDLAGNDLVIHNATAAAATTTAGNVADQLKQGFNLANSGFWNGSAGIVSSTAAGDGTHLTTLGTILNNDGTGATIYSTFDGQTVTNTDVLVKYTYFGDADLSGKVDGTDYSKIDNGFNNHLTTWFNGDFNYDGVVDGSDYSLIDNAFNTQGAGLGGGTAFAATASSMVAATASEVGSSAVPEPGSLSLLGIGAVSLLARRRRKA